AALGVGHVAEDGQDDVVGHQALRGGEEAQVAEDRVPLGLRQGPAPPELNVLGHGYLVGHPVVGAARQVVLPGPLVLEGHQLVHINGLAVDETLLRGVKAPTRHEGTVLSAAHQASPSRTTMFRSPHGGSDPPPSLNLYWQTSQPAPSSSGPSVPGATPRPAAGPGASWLASRRQRGAPTSRCS